MLFCKQVLRLVVVAHLVLVDLILLLFGDHLKLLDLLLIVPQLQKRLIIGLRREAGQAHVLREVLGRGAVHTGITHLLRARALEELLVVCFPAVSRLVK